MIIIPITGRSRCMHSKLHHRKSNTRHWMESNRHKSTRQKKNEISTWEGLFQNSMNGDGDDDEDENGDEDFRSCMQCMRTPYSTYIHSIHACISFLVHFMRMYLLPTYRYLYTLLYCMYIKYVLYIHDVIPNGIFHFASHLNHRFFIFFFFFFAHSIIWNFDFNFDFNFLEARAAHMHMRMRE